MAEGNWDLSGRIEGAKPPTIIGLELEVIRIVESTPRHFLFLSEKAWGGYFHWFGRSLKCDYPSECKRCTTSRKKWRGYIHAIEFLSTAKKEVIIELTQVALVMIDLQLATQPMRGAQFKIAKTKGGKHGRFVIESLPKRISGSTLPDAKNIGSTVESLWKINEAWSGSTPEDSI